VENKNDQELIRKKQPDKSDPVVKPFTVCISQQAAVAGSHSFSKLETWKKLSA